MRRSAAAVALTVLGLWLVLAYKSSPVPRTTGSISAVAPGTTSTQPTGAAGQPPAGPPPPAPGAGQTSTTTTTQPGSGPKTVTGDDVPTRYGDVQVAVVFNGSRIVDVKALKLPFDRARSQDISNQVAPLLHDEVVQAQSAQIDTIGGATYTSDAYAQSLQAALDKAHG